MNETPKMRPLREQSACRVLDLLNSGQIETATVSEAGLVDFHQLIAAAIPELAEDLPSLALPRGLPQRMQFVGKWILFQLGLQSFFRIAENRSDIVRSWAGYMVADIPDWSISDRLQLMRRLAMDDHPGVRNWACHALRPLVTAAPEEAIRSLLPWVNEDAENLRRYAIEATRPLGNLKPTAIEILAFPGLVENLLDKVNDDSSTYVQHSVAKWLEDAVKIQPEWVSGLVHRWEHDSTSYATRWIVQNGLKGSVLLSTAA